MFFAKIAKQMFLIPSN